MAGNWWMGWRARGLAGAEENEGQSGYGQGRSWLLGLGLRNLRGVRSSRARRVTCRHRCYSQLFPPSFPPTWEVPWHEGSLSLLHPC